MSDLRNIMRNVAIARQRSFEFRTWGGRRKRAGRKSSRPRPAIAHRAREEFRASQPVHVTLRMADHVWNLRSQRSFTIIHGALVELRRRDDVRVTEFSIQGNHVHLIVETDEPRSLANGIRALSIRLARRLNTMMGRRGPVFEDRYHTHVLRTPAEVRNALRYAVGNYASHAARRGEKVSPSWADPYASASLAMPRRAQCTFWPEPVTRAAETWLQRTALTGRPRRE
jgi:REP element-mobilizing transposase RayT